ASSITCAYIWILLRKILSLGRSGPPITRFRTRRCRRIRSSRGERPAMFVLLLATEIVSPVDQVAGYMAQVASSFLRHATCAMRHVLLLGLTRLAGLAANPLALVLDTIPLVGLRRADGAQLGGLLANRLLVDAADDDLLWV